MRNAPSPGTTGTDQLLADSIEWLSAVFDTADIEYIRSDLWQWLKAVTGEGPWSFMGNPAEVVRLRRFFCGLIETCWQLVGAAGPGEPAATPAPFSEERLAHDRQYMAALPDTLRRYGGHIRRLHPSEVTRPILFLRRFFHHSTAEGWLDIMDEWEEYGLCRTGICEATGECVEIERYELLESLLECCWYMLTELEDRPEATVPPTGTGQDAGTPTGPAAGKGSGRWYTRHSHHPREGDG